LTDSNLLNPERFQDLFVISASSFFRHSSLELRH
jgi:hypothetical protein